MRVVVGFFVLLQVLLVAPLFAEDGTVDQRVENFMLLDQHGKAHELYYNRDAAAIVIMVQGNGCPIVRNALADIKAVREQFAPKNVRFFMINSNLQDDRAAILKETGEYGIDFPVLFDESQLIGEGLGLDRTAEVLLIDPQTWRIVYRGPINDRLDYERQAAVASDNYLADAIDLLLAGEPQIRSRRQTKGCLIHFPERDRRAEHAEISYADSVAPILIERCAVCHTEGGIGPWAMSSHLMVKGFAPMMREVIRTGRMPPMHIDPEVGKFKLLHELPVDERQTLVHWIEAGAPRGDGPDPLTELADLSDDWGLGTPDLVLDLERFDVPATGLVDYLYLNTPIPIEEDVFVRAAQFLPSSRETLHHSVNRVKGSRQIVLDVKDRKAHNHLVTHVPGMQAVVYPENTGVRLVPGDFVWSQMHYTTTGKAETDSSRIGLWFSEETPEFEILYHVMNGPLLIPPMVKVHREQVYFKFLAPAVLYRLFPHAHYRATASEFRAIYPDGSEELLLSIPAYDFNWQFEYELAEPLDVPAGTMILHATTYDNSPEKRGNPDPSVTVEQGYYSEQEMLYGGITYRYQNLEDHERYNSQPFHNLNNIVGSFDKNLSGGLDKDEFDQVRKDNRLLDYAAFMLLDSNDNGEIELDEWFHHPWFKYLRTNHCAVRCF